MRSSALVAILLLTTPNGWADHLPRAEREFVAAAVRHVAANSGTQRPVVLLTRTDKWLPAAQPPDEPPAGIPADVREQQQVKITRGLRAANQAEYDLSDLPAIPGVVTYPRHQFEVKSESPAEFAKLVARLGAEPVVIKVSRPHLDAAGGSAVHSLSSWTGCGSFQLYGGVLSGGQWTFRTTGGSIIW